MARTICLIIYKSPLFPAHWSLWIPSLNNPITGKRLHATGDAANGFEVVFERDYNLDTESRSYQLLVVAEVSDTHVIDVEGNGSQGSDATAHDDVERVLLSVTPPGPSLVSSTSQLHGPRKRVQIQNCQTWLRAGVEALVQNEIMDNSALEIVENAPVN